MVIINEKKYDCSKIKVSFGKYNVSNKGKKRYGLSPFISFKCNNIYFGLETTYDKCWLEELKINDKKDISNYITDITYEDEKGWISLISGTYKCFVKRISSNIFEFEFNVYREECGEKLDILLKEEVPFVL